jgi:putative redox protein
MDLEIRSGSDRLACYLANPPVAEAWPPTLVLCHGYPSTQLGASQINRSYPELADRVANEGWRVITFAFRGCGASTGDFSLQGWLDDLGAVIEHVRAMGDTRGVWLAGFGTGAALCIAAAARNDAVSGVAALAAPADFKDWASHPRRLLQHARETGAIARSDFPASLDQWGRGLHDIRPADEASAIAPRSMLVIHGSDDESVPVFDARVLTDSHGSAELRIITGAAHDLRHDPRAVAILLGWLDRERHASR